MDDFMPEREQTLDPADWDEFRRLAHRALDDAIGYLQTVRERPVWVPVPEEVKTSLRQPIPVDGQGAEQTYSELQQLILPYASGNIHPRFFGWVQGSGTASGIVAEMMAAAMNSNCGGRDHGAGYVENCVLDWCKQIFGFPKDAAGLLVSGTSMATLIAMVVARNKYAGVDVRRDGLGASARLVAYASVEVHESTTKALETLGLGNQALRRIPTNSSFEIDLEKLTEAIAADRAAGLKPFCVVGSAGTVNTGAIDDLDSLADLCRDQDLWFHIDGAFGAIAALSDKLRPRLRGIERADSLSFDFHKWMHVQYDCGCVLVRDGALHHAAYTMRPPYLQGADRGLAAGGQWPCDFGLELSRSYRALKVWFTLKENGTRKFGDLAFQNVQQARYLAELVKQTPDLELLVEPTLNIVSFRYRAADLTRAESDSLNKDIVAELQERGIAAPSTARIHGDLAIRVCITNHRARLEDFDLLVAETVRLGREVLQARHLSSPHYSR
jgi:glutamate/tyrosine decarboxylase-like PLP-dependent enzyme